MEIVLGVSMTPTTVSIALVEGEKADGVIVEHDVFDISPSGTGSRVSYRAEMSFSGPSRIAAPLVAAYLPFLARKTVDQLRSSLDRHARTGA